MRHVDDGLRAAWQSLTEAEGDSPGLDYDRGYLTGWHDARRQLRKRIRPDGDYRDVGRVAEFRVGYGHGRIDGEGRTVDWWPDYAKGCGTQGVSTFLAQAPREAPEPPPDTRPTR